VHAPHRWEAMARVGKGREAYTSNSSPRCDTSVAMDVAGRPFASTIRSNSQLPEARRRHAPATPPRKWYTRPLGR
jgi:hypothetical protein